MTECFLKSSDDLRPICYRTLGWVLLGFVVTQMLFLWRPSVNLEFAFVEAARSLAGDQPIARMAYYWHYQANPLGYSFIASLMLRLLPMVDPMAVVRLVSVLGGVLLLVSVADLQRYLPGTNRTTDRWGLLLCAFHPMIWLYSNNATADVLPAGLTLGAIACCCRGRTRMRWHVLGIVLFSLACIVKFNCALMALGFVYILITRAYQDRGNWLTHIGWLVAYAVCSIATLGLYFLWVYHEFGIVFFSDVYKDALTFKTSMKQRLMVLLLYLDFLMLFTGPLVWVLLSTYFKKNGKWFFMRWLMLILVTCLTWISLNRIFNIGEMDFGGLVGLLPLNVLSLIQVIGIVCVYLLISLCIESFRIARQRGYIELVLAVVVPYLLISAMTRPAQRYLILILPLVLIWFVHLAWLSRPLIARMLVVSSFIIFAGLSMLGVLYFNGQAQAANRMGKWIVEHQLSLQTEPGILAAHIGYLFPVQPVGKPGYRLEVKPPKSKLTTNRTEIHVEKVEIGSLVIKRFVLQSIEVAQP